MSALHLAHDVPRHAPPLQPLLAEALRAAKLSKIEGGQSTFLRDVLTGTTPTCIRLERAAAELMAQPVEDRVALAHALCGVGHQFNRWVRVAMSIPALSLLEASVREERAASALNPLQMVPLSNCTTGDIHERRQLAVAQYEATADFIAACDREIAERELARTSAHRQLRGA